MPMVLGIWKSLLSLRITVSDAGENIMFAGRCWKYNYEIYISLRATRKRILCQKSVEQLAAENQSSRGQTMRARKRFTKNQSKPTISTPKNIMGWVNYPRLFRGFFP
jgi:hypothetical protein